jgi:arylsulfatase
VGIKTKDGECNFDNFTYLLFFAHCFLPLLAIPLTFFLIPDKLMTGLSGKEKESPRKEFIYLNDSAEVVAIRVGDWKAVYLENRAEQLQVWREPFVHLRLPLLFNLRRDPFEKAQHNSNTYHDWMIDRAFVLVPLQAIASKFLMTLKEFPPSQRPGDWSLDSLEKQIKGMKSGGE